MQSLFIRCSSWNIAVGALTSIGGFLATNGFVKISAEANRRIDRMMKDD
ncbi:hypothetical protein [Chamaesiphon minutus]|nr:hypothetical protein [Chamaesiphon minutus]